jgi:phytoene dehydrogenase-like protein
VATRSEYDAVIIGGGHNGLASAAYLARAGKKVLVLEANQHVGGAAVSERPFAGRDANISRYAYLVSLLPSQIVNELGLKLDLRSRKINSHTPLIRNGKHTGLTVERSPGALTETSFRNLTGGYSEYQEWKSFYDRIANAAKILAPTLLEPLQSAATLRKAVGDDQTWEELFELPLGTAIRRHFTDDTVRGIVATDALIGTGTSVDDESLAANRCFLYHLIGNGSGEWLVPVGGMATVSTALADVARNAGATILTGAHAVHVETDGQRATTRYLKDELTYDVDSRWILSGVAPAVLDNLLGNAVGSKVFGAQMKVNLLLTHLPKLKNGIDPEIAFRGTLHINEDLNQLETAWQQAKSGTVPQILPAEIYCHTLTDPSILGTDLRNAGWQTLTLFGLHTPPALFEGNNEAVRAQLVKGYFAGLNEYLEEPIESCIAEDANGIPCVEAKTPLDLESELGLPGGNIFHRQLQWPFAENQEEIGRWGVETAHPNILLCGAGAKRGGGVSAIPGRNAAMHVLQGGAV